MKTNVTSHMFRSSGDEAQSGGSGRGGETIRGGEEGQRRGGEG